MVVGLHVAAAKLGASHRSAKLPTKDSSKPCCHQGNPKVMWILDGVWGICNEVTALLPSQLQGEVKRWETCEILWAPFWDEMNFVVEYGWVLKQESGTIPGNQVDWNHHGDSSKPSKSSIWLCWGRLKYFLNYPDIFVGCRLLATPQSTAHQEYGIVSRAIGHPVMLQICTITSEHLKSSDHSVDPFGKKQHSHTQPTFLLSVLRIVTLVGKPWKNIIPLSGGLRHCPRLPHCSSKLCDSVLCASKCDWSYVEGADLVDEQCWPGKPTGWTNRLHASIKRPVILFNYSMSVWFLTWVKAVSVHEQSFLRGDVFWVPSLSSLIFPQHFESKLSLKRRGNFSPRIVSVNSHCQKMNTSSLQIISLLCNKLLVAGVHEGIIIVLHNTFQDPHLVAIFDP